MGSVTIGMRYRSCAGAFEKLCVDQEHFWKDDDTALLQALQNQFGRFQIWAGDTGATETGRASLEHQLRDSEDLYLAIVDLMDDLYSQLLKCSSLLRQTSRISILDLTLFVSSHRIFF